ncbi:unnamed protein product [Pseudo-nitzschia multistriata]|uniref:Uncharacterized protein n=1 Tax=Pseudo-nitzschia multistriata TaxID=183589 RepID=A0A448Z9N5_9STRA|nr:unnamed protein product [Pseudo-nitzschia multistriata]
MVTSNTILLVCSCAALQSDAFVLPIRRRAVIGDNILSTSAPRNELTTIYDGKRIAGSASKTNRTYDASPATSPLQRQVENALAPTAEFLDDISGGWALSFADLTPDSERTPVGQIFLATNLAYAIVGLVLSLKGEILLGVLTDLCSVASFVYHYTQLQQPYGRSLESTVKLALLVDYFFAREL